MQDGRAEELKAERRKTADSLALLLSAITGNQICAEQLLGEATAEEIEARDQKRMIREGERKLKRLQARMKRAQKG